MANVKGPVPPGPRMPAPASKATSRSGASGRTKGTSAKSTARTRGRLGAQARDSGQLVSDEDLEAAAGYARAHAAELEEEGRRHASGEADAERLREAEDEQQERKIKGFAFDDERRRRGKQQRDDEDGEDAEAANEAAQAAKERGLVNAEGAGRYFQELPADRLGDLTLRDPADIRRLLGPSVRFAQHAMLLAQAELNEGASRSDALAFLADLYVRVGDKAYANKALRDFGPATGILDLYPLELIEHLLEFVPGFCHRVSRGSVLSARPRDGYRAKAGQIIELTHDAKLRMRGFALKGGARPGYLFEPVDPPDQTGTGPGTGRAHYNLVFLSPGSVTVLLSAISRDGHLYLDTFDCHIEPAETEAEMHFGLRREREHELRSKKLDAAGDAESRSGSKKDDLTIHFPKRI